MANVTSIEDLIDEDAAIVLDTSAFNKNGSEGNLRNRLKEVISVRKDDPDGKVRDHDLLKDINAESKFLKDLAESIADKENVYTIKEVVDELKNYYRAMRTVWHRLVEVGIKPVEISPLISRIADAACASEIYGLNRVREFISDSKKSGQFEDCRKWIASQKYGFGFDTTKMSPEERAKEEELRLYAFCDMGPRVPKAIGFTDVRILALSLTLASYRPTITITADKHILGGARRFYNQFSGSGTQVSRPQERFKIYSGSKDGLSLSFDSENFPEKKQNIRER